MTLTAQDLVARDVHYCISSLVSTLAGGYGAEMGFRPTSAGRDANKALSDLFDQAQELAAPIDDWEETAIQAGWEKTGSTWSHPDHENAEVSAAAACVASDNWQDTPYQREVYEHWIVSEWLADKLEAKGEKVDRDFAGMTVWARTTTGQAISIDGVIETILTELVPA